MKRRPAFTLIELLVVITLIALLIAILLPAMTKSRDISRTLRCQTNLKQMEIGMQSFGFDNGGLLMSIRHGDGKYWYHRLVDYIGESAYAQNADDTDLNSVGLCPSTELTRDSDESGPGTASTAWTVFKGAGSYGSNLWRQPWETEEDLFKNEYTQNLDKYYTYFDNIDKPSETPGFADCNWVGGWPVASGQVPEDLEVGTHPYRHGWSVFMGRFAIDRHERRINIAYSDGSVAPVLLEDLWQTNWHRGFVGREVTINY